MKITDVKNGLIAKKYATALYEEAEEKHIVEKVYNDLIFIVETFNSNSELKEFSISPIINKSDKQDVLGKLFSPHCEITSVDFIKMLVDCGRMSIINEILNQFVIIFDKKNNIAKPIITSAVELDDNQKETILGKLSSKLSKTIKPEYVVNPDIIGGLIIDIEDKTIDFSLKSKFDNMKKTLTKGNRYGNN